MTTSIIVVCLPALRPLLRRAGELSSTDPKPSENRITRAFKSTLSKTGLSTLGSSRIENRKGSSRGRGVDRMNRLSDRGDSQVELTTQSETPVIYKSQDISVHSTRFNPSDSADREAERQIGLGSNTTAWHA